MTQRRRSTLKHFFRQGALPSADQFGDFIDSTVNQVDDGFEKTAKEGIKISSLAEFENLISFFRESRPEQALWTIGYDGKQDKLLFKKLGQAEDDVPPVLSLSPDGKVGINRKDPDHALDVDGTLSAKGRIGVASGDLRVPADGGWHDITETLTGCHAFEVMAGVGKAGSGKYALMHAVAMNAFNPSGALFNFFRRKNPIKCQHAYYSDRNFRLHLRWKTVGSDRTYKLQLRSGCRYYDESEKEEVYVSYYLTKLWFDAGMEKCVSAAGKDDKSGGSGA